jgi:ribosomal protein S18 acetylase RimI-like enzyme
MTNTDDRLNIVFVRVPTEDQIRQIESLYREQGWWRAEVGESRQLIPDLIAGSHCFVISVECNDIVGMGRAISDGVSDAYIQDLTVRGDHRNRGIGRLILEALMERLHSDGFRWIGLIAEPGSSDLYRGVGFEEMSGCIPMLMNRKP